MYYARISLYNKDNLILKFGIERTKISVNYHQLSDIHGEMPIGFTTFSEWLDTRFILTHRNQVSSLFESLGVSCIEDYISITNCISLTDTYWVQEVGQNKTWNEVSPYRNSLNTVVSEFSFTGKVMDKNITSSPDFSTAGKFPKCWIRRDTTLYLCKAGTDWASNSGYEPFSEIFCLYLRL